MTDIREAALEPLEAAPAQAGRRRRGRTAVRVVVSGLVTLLVVSALTFFVTNYAGADPAKAAVGRLATPEQVELFRGQQGLDEPVGARYWTWLKNFVTGDWGISLQTREPVTDIVLPRLGRSVLLAVVALLVALPIAFAIGALAARRPGGKLDNVLSTATLFVIGLPEFVVGLLLLYLFAVWLDVLPPDSTGVTFGSFGDKVEAYLLPALTLAILLTPYIARMVRASVREVLGTPYVQTAVLRGVPGFRLFARHVMPNAVGPVVNVIALSLAEVLTGIVVVENVFGFPGLGQLTVTSLGTSDIAVIQACVVIAATGFILLNFAADALVVLLNPRLRRAQTA